MKKLHVCFWVHKRYPVGEESSASVSPACGTLSFVFDKATSKGAGTELPSTFTTDRVQQQRKEILLALAEEVSARGYRAVKIADVLQRAGVTRATFDANFSSKEDCFLALQQLATEESLDRVIAAAGSFESWPERVGAGVAAFLDYTATEPACARAWLVEGLAASPSTRRQHEETQRVFVSLLETGRNVSSQSKPVPDVLEEAIVGGIFWIIYQRLILGREESIIENLCPKIVEFALTPYVGAEAARRTATTSRPSERQKESPGAKKLVA